MQGNFIYEPAHHTNTCGKSCYYPALNFIARDTYLYGIPYSHNPRHGIALAQLLQIKIMFRRFAQEITRLVMPGRMPWRRKNLSEEMEIMVS